MPSLAGHKTLNEAFGAIDRAFAEGAAAHAAKTPEQRDAEFRAYHLNAARQLLAGERRFREWTAAVDAANPVGPSVNAFYRGGRPDRVALRLAEVARHRRLAAGALRSAA